MEGWNSWNHFHCSINETVVQQTVDAIVSTGLATAGYQYSLFYSYSSYTKYHPLRSFCSKFGRLLAK